MADGIEAVIRDDEREVALTDAAQIGVLLLEVEELATIVLGHETTIKRMKLKQITSQLEKRLECFGCSRLCWLDKHIILWLALFQHSYKIYNMFDEMLTNP
ncbi:hypothetical protein M5689_016943 [Euphorbia peplus]|nr:hypothetical protein M5689_016943 [Euphorbia peplus]